MIRGLRSRPVGSPNAKGAAFSGQTRALAPYDRPACAFRRVARAYRAGHGKLSYKASAFRIVFGRGRQPSRTPLSLPALHTRVLLVDHINPPTASHHAAVLVAYLSGTQAVTNSHDALLTRADEGRLGSCPFLPCQARRVENRPPRPHNVSGGLVDTSRLVGGRRRDHVRGGP